MNDPTLTLIVFGPLVLGLTLFLSKEKDRLGLMEWALFASGVPFLYSLSLLKTYDPSGEQFQHLVRLDWIAVGDRLRIEYYMGVDGISLFLVLLTTFLTPIVIASTYRAVEKHYREFLFMLLALETAILGTFLALDLLLFYIFWEAVLIPMYFLIGIWGSDDRIRSAMKFVLFTMTGSVLMLVAILVLHSVSSTPTFDLIKLYQDPGVRALGQSSELWLFWAFFVAFAIKVPLFPLHTWLPDAHTDAPTAGSVILAGVLLKMGTYGILRFCLPLFPEAVHLAAPTIAILAVIGIIYGAWVATVQRDVKRLVAYSSVSHLGLIVLGIFAFTPNALTGAVVQMINHGLTTGALFLIVGMLYERRHTRRISEFGGLLRIMPLLGVILWIITFASIGLPPLNGFIGEFLILFGVFEASGPLYTVLGAFAVTGVIWGAVYMLWMFERVMLGEVRRDENKILPDLDMRELFILVPIVVLVFAIGLFSPYLTHKIEPSVLKTLDYASADLRETPGLSGDPAQQNQPENTYNPDPAHGPENPSTGMFRPGTDRFRWDESSRTYVPQDIGGGL
jgi:NADH-quinone oxidoreductase subunit M